MAAGAAVPLSAQLMCGPVIVVLQPQFATYSLLANVLAAPLVAPVTILGTAAVPLVPLLPWLATALIGVAGLFAAGVAGIARFMAGLPGAAPPWPEGPFGLLTMVLTYPVMKAIHETGHGVVLHHFGGDTRECGVMLLLFFPVPYVDASATNAVPAPAARMLVGAAGILAELACASVALLLWLMIEPGPEQAILYSFMVMGAISTLAWRPA